MPKEGDANTRLPLASDDERQQTVVHSRALLASGLGGLVVGVGVLQGVYSGGGTERPHFFKLVRYEPFTPLTEFTEEDVRSLMSRWMTPCLWAE